MKQFSENIAFTGSNIDLKEDARDADSIRAYLADPNARALMLCNGGPAVDASGNLIWRHPNDLKGQNVLMPVPVLLGVDDIGPIFAFNMPEDTRYLPQDSFKSMREAAQILSGKSLALAGQARSLFSWHTDHRFCANCGAQSQSASAGQARHCSNCQADHFPRVNPVVIMLVLNGDKCLLGRNESWPEKNYSALAGFVSPGESVEEACRREVKEESGLTVTDVEYQFSQPWPFPSQLMLGLTCQAINPKALRVNPKELEDAKWFSRDEIKSAVAGTSDVLQLPPDFTIAKQLIRSWLAVETSA